MMTKYTRCRQCGGLLEDDGSCSCGAKRGAKDEPTRKGPDLCAWDDHGSRCPCRGIMSDTTTGGGKWYCREHWGKVRKQATEIVGNRVPGYVQSLAAQEWHAAMAEHLAAGGHSILHAKPVLQNPLPVRERSPGDDDEEVTA